MNFPTAKEPDTVGARFSREEFEDLLTAAESNTQNEWEEEFVCGLRIKYKQFRLNTFLSDKQLDKLTDIAEGGE